MSDIIIEKFNDVFCKIHCDRGIAKEIQDRFSFLIKDWRFHPLVKQRRWDGKIRLYNMQNRQMYVGLIPDLLSFAQDSEYKVDIDQYYDRETRFTDTHFNKFIESLKLTKTPRDYQYEYFKESIKNKRSIILSPTGSGKSLVIYLLSRWNLDVRKSKTLLIVPTTSLVYQMYNDFKEYGWSNIDEYVHTISDGSTKVTDKPIIISTWQALLPLVKKMKKREDQFNPNWFKQFGCIIGDEAHTFSAESLKLISEASVNAKLRFGLSGTLEDSITSEMSIKGIFGPIIKYISTSDLIENGTLSDFEIRCLIFNYSNEIKEYFHKSKKKIEYENEIDFLIASKTRNKKLTNLALSLKGNTILLFRFVEKHGKVLYEMIKEQINEKGIKRNVYFYSGNESGKERDEMRAIIENEKDAIIVGSIQTIATGINIVNLNNLIFTHPQKGKIKVLQAIGRLLRNNGSKAYLYDIVDDIRTSKRENYAYTHFQARLESYINENLDYKIINVP